MMHSQTPPDVAFNWAKGEEDRLSLLPVKNREIWDAYKKLEALHWTAQEVDLGRDRRDWEVRMTPDQRHFITMQLAFFSRIDIDVLEGIDDDLREEVDCLEAKMFYSAQSAQECVHAEAYALQIEAVLEGPAREAALNAVQHYPIIAKMRAWVTRRLGRGSPIGERLVAFAAVEGVLFSASFCALQWLREGHLLPGVTAFNDFISRDEGVHAEFTCMLVRGYLKKRPPVAQVVATFAELIEIIDEFVTESLPVSLIGMNATLMKEYVRFQADCILVEMGYRPQYKAKNPFGSMDKMSLNSVAKVNFFEELATQYQTITVEGATRLALDPTPVTW